MGRVVPDTDLLSEVFKGRDAGVSERARRYVAVHGRLMTTSATVAEIVKGVAELRDESRLNRVLNWLARPRCSHSTANRAY